MVGLIGVRVRFCPRCCLYAIQSKISLSVCIDGTSQPLILVCKVGEDCWIVDCCLPIWLFADCWIVDKCSGSYDKSGF